MANCFESVDSGQLHVGMTVDLAFFLPLKAYGLQLCSRTSLPVARCFYLQVALLDSGQSALE